MWKGQTFHIEGYVTIDGRYLVGTNKDGKTQTVEDILNGLSGSAQFNNIVAIETEYSKWLKELDKKFILLSLDNIRDHYNLSSKHTIYIIYPNGKEEILNMNIDKENFEKQLCEAKMNDCLFGRLRD